MGTNLSRFPLVPVVFTFSQADDAPTPICGQFHHSQDLFLVVCEHAWFRALTCLNNIHFSACAPCPGTDTKCEQGLRFQTRGARVVQWWEHSPPTNVVWVRFPDPASYVGWVCCWFSPCSKRFFCGYSGFPISSKTNISKFQFNLESEGHRFVSHKTVRCYPR